MCVCVFFSKLRTYNAFSNVLLLAFVIEEGKGDIKRLNLFVVLFYTGTGNVINIYWPEVYWIAWVAYSSLFIFLAAMLSCIKK